VVSVTFGAGFGGFCAATDWTIFVSAVAPVPMTISSPVSNPVRVARRICVAPATAGWLSEVGPKMSAPVSNE
jgi:hypothetical protein